MTKKAKLSPREARLKRLYGLEPGEYEKVLEFQKGVCYICGKPPKPGKSLHVDHDHKTGLTRGLLCWKDNAAVAKFKDDVFLLLRAAVYLSSPPVKFALKREVYGRTGRITNKRKRKKRKNKKVK